MRTTAMLTTSKKSSTSAPILTTASRARAPSVALTAARYLVAVVRALPGALSATLAKPPASRIADSISSRERGFGGTYTGWPRVSLNWIWAGSTGPPACPVGDGPYGSVRSHESRAAAVNADSPTRRNSRDLIVRSSSEGPMMDVGQDQGGRRAWGSESPLPRAAPQCPAATLLRS